MRCVEERESLYIAAGNNGVSAQIGTPGSAEDVITVGALDKDTSIAIIQAKDQQKKGVSNQTSLHGK